MPSTPRQRALEAAAFLKHLRATGNARLAAERAGLPRARFLYRRRHDPDFAARWEAALAVAHVTLVERRDGASSARPRPDATKRLATEPDGFVVVQGRGDRPQLRRGGAWSGEGRRRFLTVLGATANVRLAAAASGVSRPTVYRHARLSSSFAAEMAAAIVEGRDRVATALLEAALHGLSEDNADLAGWRDDAPYLEPLTLMTINQAVTAYEAHPHAHPRRVHTTRQPTSEEVDAVIRRSLDREKRRMARDGGR